MNLTLADTVLPLGDVTYVMGVINTSPESKNTHTVAETVDEVLAMAERYREWGAHLIDLGGQSSHYATPTIAAAEETARVVPAIEALASEGHLVSIDTWKPEVALAAVEAGAVIINDTGGLADPEMRQVAASTGAAVIAVYIEGANPHDLDAVDIRPDKAAYTAQRLRELVDGLAADGIDNVILDPGIAFNYPGNSPVNFPDQYDAYSRLQWEVIADSDRFRELGLPLLIPIPRKPLIHRVIAYIALALEHRADMIRVHDIEIACDLARVFGRSG